jgi:hypothetical protein
MNQKAKVCAYYWKKLSDFVLKTKMGCHVFSYSYTGFTELVISSIGRIIGYTDGCDNQVVGFVNPTMSSNRFCFEYDRPLQ